MGRGMVCYIAVLCWLAKPLAISLYPSSADKEDKKQFEDYPNI